MKAKASFIIVLISILLCCSIFGSAFALYSVNASLDISFSGYMDEVIEYYLKITEGVSEIATVKLSENELTTSEYSTTAYLKTTYKLSFYKNNKMLSVGSDFQYDENSDVTDTISPSYEFNYNITFKPSSTGLSYANVDLDENYYIVGDFNDWSIGENAIKMTTNPENNYEVMSTGIPITAGKCFKIRNYKGYYGTVNTYSQGVYEFDDSGNIVLKFTSNYDFYYDTNANSVYISASGMTLYTTKNNPSWVAWYNQASNVKVKIFAVGSDGKFYQTLLYVESDGSTTVQTLIPTSLSSVTLWRANPSVTEANFNTTSDKWNNVTVYKANYGQNGQIWN